MSNPFLSWHVHTQTTLTHTLGWASPDSRTQSLHPEKRGPMLFLAVGGGGGRQIRKRGMEGEAFVISWELKTGKKGRWTEKKKEGGGGLRSLYAKGLIKGKKTRRRMEPLVVSLSVFPRLSHLTLFR